MGAVADLAVPQTGAVAALPAPDTGASITPEQADAQNFAATSGGFARGLRGAFNSAGASVNALAGQGALSLAERLGDSSISLGLTEFANDRFEQSKAMAEFSDSVSPDVRDIQGVKDFSTASEYVAGKIGEGIGSTAPAIAAGVLLRRPIAGIFGTTLPQEAGGQVMTARADPTVMATKSATDILANAAGVGTINAGIETLGGPTRVAKNILSPTKMAKGVVKDIAKTAGEQGLQEGAQQTVQQAGHTLLNEGRDKSADTMDTVNAVIGGAIGGAGIGTAGHIATSPVTAYQAIKSGTPTVDHVKEVFTPPEAPVDPNSMDYPDHLTTPEQVADFFDTAEAKGKENLSKFWESIKDSPLGQKTKDWMENPTSSEELHAAATKAFNESTVGPQVKAIFGGFKEFLDRKKQANSKDSLMRTRVDDNILDHAVEKIPENVASVMTAEHKIKLVDMLKTAVKAGEVPEGLIHLYGDAKTAESVVMNAASLMEAEPAKISKHFAATAKQVEDRNDTVEDLVRNNLRPELYTNREMRDTVMKNFVPELQRYASLGAKDEKAMVQKLEAAFGDKAELVTDALDKIRQQTTSARATESAAKPDLEAQDTAPETESQVPSFQNDARLNRVYTTLEDVRSMVDELKKEYGRGARFQTITEEAGKYHIVAQDAIGDESGFDDAGWSRLWNAESKRQNKSGLENGVLTVNRADGRKNKISLMSLVMEMGSRYGRDGGDQKGSNRVGDLLFRGISQLISDPSVRQDKPFANLKAGADTISFPDNMRIGKFDGKEYFWKDVKHYVLSKEDLTGVTDEAINTIRNTKRENGTFPTRQEAVAQARKEAQQKAEFQTTGQDVIGQFSGEQKQGPEFHEASDALADDQTPAKLKAEMDAETEAARQRDAKVKGKSQAEGLAEDTPNRQKLENEFTERRRPGRTIREQDDVSRKGEKGDRRFAEFTGEELHPPESAGVLATAKTELAYKKEIADRIIKNLLNGKLDMMIERVKAATDIRALYHTLDILHEFVPYTERNSFWQKHAGLPDGAKETDNLRQAVKKLEPVLSARVKELGPRPTETRAQEANRKAMDAAKVDPGTSRDNAMDTRTDLRHVSPIKHSGEFNWREHKGKGEGHAAFGAGTYLLSDDKVHAHYKRAFSEDNKTTLGSRTVAADGSEELRQFFKYGKVTKQEAANAATKLKQRIHELGERFRKTGDIDVADARTAAMEALVAVNDVVLSGKDVVDFKQGDIAPTYHIRLHADDTELMDWNKPLSEQSEFVQKALKPALEKMAMRDVKETLWMVGEGGDDHGYMRVGGKEYAVRQSKPDEYDFYEQIAGISAPATFEKFTEDWAKSRTGDDLYKLLAKSKQSQTSASDYLQSLGIIGHVYNAEGGKGKTNRNYVIYDDSRLENTHVSFSNMNVDPKEPLDPKLEQEIRDYVAKVLGPKAKVLFEKMEKAGNFAKLSGVETLRISIHALDPRGIGFHEAAHALFARLLAADPKSKIMLEQAARSPIVMAQLRKLLADHPRALKQLEDSEERVAYMYQFWAGGQLTLGPKTTTLFERVKNFLKQIVAYLSASADGPEDMARVERILTAFHSGELAEASTVREVLATKNKPDMIEQANAMLGPVGIAAKHVAFTAQGIVRGLKQPALDEIMDKFNPAVGAEGKERGYLGGMVNERTRLASEWTIAVGKASAPDMRMALEHLQQGTKPTDPSVKHIYDATRKMLDHLYKYQIDAGVKRRVGVDKESGVVEYEDIGFLKDYFPRVYDQSYLDSHGEEFMALLKKYNAPDPKEIYSKIMRDTDSIKAGTDDMNAALMYFNPHTQKRTLVDIPMAELAPYLAKDLPGTMLSYISRSVRRAEYTKRFDNSGEKIQEALAEAKKNGLTPEGAVAFNKAVEAMEGAIRPDMNRDLRKIQGGLMTYQNIRLLPLALFSNLVDPIGIMVRGGSIKDATDTYKNALKSIFSKNEAEGYDMAVMIGSISAAQGDEFMSQAFGTQFIAPWQKRLNDWFFAYNGLEGWNKMNRIGATVAAEHFIIKQAVDPREHSERYLRELNLTAKEVKDAIVKQPDQSGKLVDHLDLSNAKIRDAMNIWVDGAIIRPNAAIRPIWMSDPAFMLVAHLKQYLYGVQEVLLGRLAHEAKNGNTTPMLAMASMIPVMVAADMARVILTPSGDDDGLKASWGFFDWIFNGMQRIGLFGIGQYIIEMGSKGNNATYIMGPTVNQIAGAFHQNLSTTLAKAIPGASMFDRDLLIPQD